MIEGVREYWPALLLAAFAVLAAAFMLGSDAPVARRVFVQFLGRIALPLAVIFGTPLLGLALLVTLPEALWQAIIAGVVIATGWLTAAIFAELGKAQAKAERMRDYHKAIFAEIRNSLSVLYGEGEAGTDAGRILSRMRADKGFVPLIPREHFDVVYNAVLDEIEVLPRVTIDPIVAYYSLVKSIAAQAEDMRGKRFASLEQERRIQMYEDYFGTRARALEVGDYALQLIKEFSDNGPAAAERLAEKLSNPDAGRNGRPSPETE